MPAPSVSLSDPLGELERRHDDALRQLDELEKKIEQALKEFSDVQKDAVERLGRPQKAAA